jgi:hypothetical protein
MSRIDTHISRIRNKLAMAEFVHSGSQALLVGALVVLAYVLLRQFTLMVLPHEWILLGVVGGLTVFYAIVMAILRRPDELVTAVAIDDRLGLKEKFSTALHARKRTDPFSQAAVVDAEQTAQSVSLYKHFPIKYPNAIGHALVVGIVGLALLMFVEPRNLFASDAPKVPPKKIDEAKEKDEARAIVKQAIAAIEMQPKSVAEEESIQLAKAELRELAKAPNIDAPAAKRKALSTLQDLQSVIKQQIDKNQKFADAKNQERLFQKMDPGDEAAGPVADAQREIAKGNLGAAIDKIDDVVKKFDQLDEEKQKQAAQQMQQMAKQLQQMANNPQAQQQMQQKLQQMGMNQQQAQQAMNAMQQAAQGNPQAQQQLQQMAQQAMQQMNNGQGATAHQQQQIQQALQQMQGQANTQAQAQQLAQAAQAMAQAMQQQAAQQGQPGQAGQQGQQANQGQNSQQNGQQPGGQTPQQQMAQAGQQMQQQLQQMQAIAQDAQQVQAAQQAAQQAQQAAQGGLANNAQQGQGQQGQGQQGQGQQGQQPGAAQGPGVGQGQGMNAASGAPEAPFTTKQEVSKSKDIEKGRIIAATFVKADALKGESKAEVREVAEAAMQESTDEVDTERVSRQAQKVVKDYFGSMGE